MKIKSDALSVITGGELIGDSSVFVRGFKFDSREIRDGDVFICLRGRRDGHLFIEDAFCRGAYGCIVESGGGFDVEDGRFFIEVDDTLEAFSKIALWRRGKFEGRVIGVTGSVGKTTTKELLYFVLSKFFKVHLNPASYNNIIGVSFTVSNIPDDAQIVVQEMGSNSPGEIRELSRIVLPDIGVVTSIGESHIGRFGGYEGVLREKLSIMDFCGVGVLPHNLPLRVNADVVTFGDGGDIFIESVIMREHGSEYTLVSPCGRFTGYIGVPGRGILNSVMAVAGVLCLLDLGVDALGYAYDFKPPKWRLDIRQLGGIRLICDFYNSSPTSMYNAIEVFSLFKGRKVAILGDMLELGDYSEQKHMEVGRILSNASVDLLLTCGRYAHLYGSGIKSVLHYHFEDVYELVDFIKGLDMDGSIVLIKGSRANKLELVLEFMEDMYGSCGDKGRQVSGS